MYISNNDNNQNNYNANDNNHNSNKASLTILTLKEAAKKVPPQVIRPLEGALPLRKRPSLLEVTLIESMVILFRNILPLLHQLYISANFLLFSIHLSNTGHIFKLPVFTTYTGENMTNPKT